jgi:hypothetical protein
MRFLSFRPLLLGIFSACGDATAPPAATFQISPGSLELSEGRFGSLTLLTSLPDNYLPGLTYWSYVSDEPSGGGGVGFSEGFLLPWPQEVSVHAWGATTGRVIVEHASALLADTIPIRVHGVSVAAVNLEPVSGAISVGGWTDLYPQIVDSVGVNLQRFITWSSSDSSVATVEYWSSSGFSSGFSRVWGLRPGTATVSATADDVTADFTIVVTGP